jgi:ATP-dependent RNA helicase DDX51/DBP6
VSARKQATDSPDAVKTKKKSNRELLSKPPESSELQDAATEEATPEASGSSKKSKKRKRESKVVENHGPEEDATPKKHKTILSKFERSAKVAEAARANAESDGGEGAKEEQPVEELHGSSADAL